MQYCEIDSNLFFNANNMLILDDLKRGVSQFYQHDTNNLWF